MKEILSVTNPEVKHLVSLRQKSSVRRETGTFVIEGERLVLDAPPEAIVTVYVTAQVCDRMGAALRARIPEECMVILSDSAMEKASDTKSPQGILAEVLQPRWDPDEVMGAHPLQRLGAPDGRRAALLLALEDVRDPGNLGTIFRTAEAAGASGLILTDRCADVFNPKTVRATMSAIFRMPFVTTGNLPAVLEGLRERSIQICAACLRKGSVSYETLDYRGPTAFLVGNEANGLRDETIQAADAAVQIPMQGQIESLNAAISAGILLYEAARQRGFSQRGYR